MVQLAAGRRRRRRRSPRAAPTCATGCPACTRTSDFGMRFVGALEDAARPDRGDARRAARALRPRPRAARHARPARAPGSGVDLDESQSLRDAARARPPGRRARPPARHAARPGARAEARVPRRSRCASRTRAACVWSADDDAGISARRSSSCIATSRSRRKSKPPSHVASSSTSRYTPPTGCG